MGDYHYGSLPTLKRTVKERVRQLQPLKHLLLAVFLHYMAMYMTAPAITDVTMAALCHHSKPCNRAIYLTGLQQTITGVGTMIMTPIFGGFSDRYGRKPLLLVMFTISIFPHTVLSYSRTREFVYIFYVVDTIASVIVDGSVNCLTLAYVADTVEEHARSSTFGIVAGVISLGYVVSTLVARAISESYIFQFAAALAILSTLYMKVFVVETVSPQSLGDKIDAIKHSSEVPHYGKSKTWLFCMDDVFGKIKSSPILVQVIVISFFCGLADAGLQGVLWYYLKSTFNFGKNQFSELMLIGGSASVFLQLIVMPFLVPLIGEKMILCIGLFGDFFHAILYGVAWAPWVPYFCASAASLTIVIYSSISSIVSKEVTPEQQGGIQGIVSGVRSLALIVAPLAVTPLSALFFSDHPPFRCRGFSILCMAFALLIAVIQGCLLKQPATPLHRGTKYIQVPCEEKYHVEPPILVV